MKYILDCMGHWKVTTIYSSKEDARKDISPSEAHCFEIVSLPENKKDWETLVKDSPIYQELIELRELKKVFIGIQAAAQIEVDREINIRY